MRELVEKIVAVLALIAIAVVAGVIGLQAFAIPRSSGISAHEADADQDVIDWLASERRVVRGPSVMIPVLHGETSSSPPLGHGPSPVSGWRPMPEVSPSGLVPDLRYVEPREISRVEYERLQGFDEAYEAAKGAAGQLVDGKFRIDWVDPTSALARRIGLQTGDKIVSINGLRVGQSFASNRALYEALRGQKQLSLLLERNGSRVLLSFFTN